MIELNKIGVPINTVLNEPCLDTMAKMPDKCINMVMTSPPYWSLRDYGTGTECIWGGDKDCEHIWGEKIPPRGHKCGKPGPNAIIGAKGAQDNARRGSGSNFCSKCGAWKGQLGLEPNFDDFINNLCDIFDEVKRVLRDDGVIFVNLSDTYGGSNSRASAGGRAGYGTEREGIFNNQMPAKSQCAIPERFVIEMLNRGWIKRNTIIWHKKNCMPSSVKDRFTVDFEYLFFFSKKKNYYFEQQFDKHQEIDRRSIDNNGNRISGRTEYSDAPYQSAVRLGQGIEGRNKRTVWTINPKPFSEAHFAVYPEELCETPIKAGCPEFVCVKCGKPRERIIEAEGGTIGRSWHNHKDDMKVGQRAENQAKGGHGYKRIDKGYTDCGCGAKFTGGIVYDPFAGSGTTGLVAHRLNRQYILSEMKKEYCEIAEKRLSSTKQIQFA